MHVVCLDLLGMQSSGLIIIKRYQWGRSRDLTSSGNLKIVHGVSPSLLDKFKLLSAFDLQFAIAQNVEGYTHLEAVYYLEQSCNDS